MRRFSFAWLLLGLLIVAAPVHADDKKAGRDQEMIRRLRQQIQQSQQEAEQAKAQAAQAAQDATEAKAQIDKARGEAARIRGQVGSAERRAAAVQEQLTALEAAKTALEAEVAALTARLNDTQGRLVDTQAKLAETIKTLQASDANGARLKIALAAEEASHLSCEKKNIMLYGYSQELLGRYQSKGLWSVLKQAEPVTGFAQVDIENIAEEYRAKLDAEKIAQPQAKDTVKQ